jgi:sigma-B regulation protein RsbU (phosphoserine phosphatase)
MFGKDRFKAIIRQNAELTADGIRTAIIEAVQNFRQGAPQEDDITLVVLKVL